MPFKWVPNAAGTPPDSHDGHFGFWQAIAQVYRFVVKPARDRAANRRTALAKPGFTAGHDRNRFVTRSWQQGLGSKVFAARSSQQGLGRRCATG
jgi:hypothetical protein